MRFARRTSAKEWTDFARELPATSRFVRLTSQHHHLAKLNSVLLLRVWEELGGVVGFNGALLVGKYSLRLAAGTDLVPASREVAARVKEVQSGAYECLVTAAREGAAISTATESFTLLLPSEITNEVAREAIRALIPTLPLAKTLGVLSEEECRIRAPGTWAHPRRVVGQARRRQGQNRPVSRRPPSGKGNGRAVAPEYHGFRRSPEEIHDHPASDRGVTKTHLKYGFQT